MCLLWALACKQAPFKNALSCVCNATVYHSFIHTISPHPPSPPPPLCVCAPQPEQAGVDSSKLRHN